MTSIGNYKMRLDPDNKGAGHKKAMEFKLGESDGMYTLESRCNMCGAVDHDFIGAVDKYDSDETDAIMSPESIQLINKFATDHEGCMVENKRN